MKVISGKNNWLFLDNDSNHIVSQLTGELVFSEKELYQWRLLLEMRSLWLKQNNISYFFLVAPNKACVYPEYLPDSIQLSEHRCINQLINYLSEKSFFNIIYPLPELLQAKYRKPVYYLTDTHWNFFGAYTAYYALLSEISKFYDILVLPESSITFDEFFTPTAMGDLGLQCNACGDYGVTSTIIEPKATCIFNNEIINTGNLMIFENSNKSLPKAVMFRDSFANAMLEFVAESFSRLVVVWQPNIDYAIVEAEMPDIVMSQQVERFLIKIPNDLSDLTNKERLESKPQA